MGLLRYGCGLASRFRRPVPFPAGFTSLEVKVDGTPARRSKSLGQSEQPAAQTSGGEEES